MHEVVSRRGRVTEGGDGGFAGQADLDRQADRDLRRGPSAAAQAGRPARVRVRCHLVDGVRDRRDPRRAAHPGRHRRRGVGPARAAGDRRRGAPGDRRGVVPPDDLRLPVRWRVLRRVPREPRPDAGAGRRRLAAHRLHPHRRRVDRRRRAGDPVGVRVRQPLAGPAVPGPDRRDDDRQPARPQGIGGRVRPADLPVHRAC